MSKIGNNYTERNFSMAYMKKKSPLDKTVNRHIYTLWPLI